jgi:hypothetical protein
MRNTSRTAWRSLGAAALLAVLTVPAVATDATALAARIDKAIGEKITAEKVTPSPKADDAEFLRRVYLDLTGVIPPADKAAAFLDNKDPAKRTKLIDELLDSPAFGRHMADMWRALLVKKDPDNRRVQFDPLDKWLAEQFNANKGWDKIASDVVTASGPVDENGAVTFWLANNTVDKMTDTVSRTLLGVQLQCAQCHNHPFTKWKQEQYWGMAAFFMQVAPNANPNAAAKNGTTLSIAESPRPRRQRLPESAKMVPARYFQGDEVSIKTGEARRPYLAKWLANADNPYFAKAFVNRTWAQLFGKGFVTPVDDIHDGNTPSHPELFKSLASDFAKGGFDIKNLYRTICTSETYQRTSKPLPGNEEADERLFARAAVKPMTPEQLFDSLDAIIGTVAAPARPNRPAAAQRLGPQTARQQFVAFFEVDETTDRLEYAAGIPQVLRLMNSPQYNRGATVLRSIGRNEDPAKAIEKLFLTTLARRPNDGELGRMVEFVKTHAATGYQDVLWALLNSSEFVLNH